MLTKGLPQDAAARRTFAPARSNLNALRMRATLRRWPRLSRRGRSQECLSSVRPRVVPARDACGCRARSSKPTPNPLSSLLVGRGKRRRPAVSEEV